MIDPPMKTFAAAVEDFLARTGMSISKFGDLACNDRNFVADMRRGQRECRFSTIRKVEAFMAEWDREHPQTVDNSTGNGRAA